MEKRVEVTGGSSHTQELFSTTQNTTTFSAWLESLHASPGLVSYSLAPIHTLVGPGDPRQEALRQAVKEYVAERGLRRRCPQHCPEGGSVDSCKCHCSSSSLTDSTCCPLRRGLARLSVHVQWGRDLWGDHITATDAYVKVFFQGRELQTGHIDNDNNPEWDHDMDFGEVTLPVWPELHVEVWDKDRWEDDLLGTCSAHLKAVRRGMLLCHLEWGHVVFSYSLECRPHLGGDSCWEYVPVRG
nr:perforin-1-like [Pelodiscus sinensis]|eukprot:XP_025046117.1 perforin-1-like [Pelodiscus sinensis]